jgi:eukaryotic-like serine/threonine-protein kinase
MPARVELEMVAGALQGQRFVYDQRTTCLIGRDRECNIAIPEPPDRRIISRHHCVLDINPPHVRIRDLGSLNGTFLNGENIGQRSPQGAASQADAGYFAERDARDGDLVSVGTTEFRIRTVAAAFDARCSEPTESFIPVGHPERLEPLSEATGTVESSEKAMEGYQLLRELGRGGMGVVYLAREEATGREIALKVMLAKVAVEPRAREAFLREIATTQALRHEHVVHLYRAVCSDAAFYFTLEYCDAGSITQSIKLQGKLSVDEAVEYTLQALKGLKYVHLATIRDVKLKDGGVGRGQGLVHRDIKPSNLFLSKSADGYIVKIGDYGLAKAFDLAGLSGHTGTGQVGGTFQYMPRQQLLNYRHAGPEVDVWAVAASMYKMLTGHVPRDFRCGLEPWRVVLETKPIPILQRNSGIPARLAEVIDHALVDDPEIGFQTVAEFELALRQALGAACE